MRVLKFIIDGQKIWQDPSCDFSGIAPGTKGYLKAEFSFSQEWKGCRKAAVFESLGKEIPIPLINGQCWIPERVLDWKIFSVKIIGESEGYRITTNRVEVQQDG